MVNMQVKQIAQRIKELREILEMPAEELAGAVHIAYDEYIRYELGEDDIPIGVLYGVAGVLGVDPTVLLTGESPRMKTYTIVRGGKGVSVERFPGYSFTSLASNYIERDMEPMLVDLAEDNEPELVSHSGQEFNYVLEGTVKVVLEDREFYLRTGDSIYFDPSTPHGQRAVDGPARFLTVINE